MKSIVKKSIIPFSILCVFLMVFATSFQPVAASEKLLEEEYQEQIDYAESILEKIEKNYPLEATIDPGDNPDWLPWFPGKFLITFGCLLINVLSFEFLGKIPGWTVNIIRMLNQLGYFLGGFLK